VPFLLKVGKNSPLRASVAEGGKEMVGASPSPEVPDCKSLPEVKSLRGRRRLGGRKGPPGLACPRPGKKVARGHRGRAGTTKFISPPVDAVKRELRRHRLLPNQLNGATGENCLPSNKRCHSGNSVKKGGMAAVASKFPP